MFTITINVPEDVLSAGNGALPVAMYGQLLASYTPASGPSSGQALAADQWVYFTGSDYAAVSGSVPAFATYSSSGAQRVSLPDVFIAAAHIVFGIGTLPAIPVDSSGAPQQPSPVTAGGIYDFVEFTWNTAGALFINTTMIDQFGFPIQIQITPADAILPNGVGVTMDRADVFNAYTTYVKDQYNDFMQCAQDAFGNPLTERLLSPKYALTGNCVQGVVANPFSGPVSTLAAGGYYYAVTALNSAGVESFAQYEIVQTVVTAGQAVSVAWAPNSSQPAGTASYNVYRGIASGSSVTWGLIGNAAASTFGTNGGSFADCGQAPGTSVPALNPLASLFDSEIQTFFATYQNAASLLILTATDGTDDGYVYSFSGATVADSTSGNILYLQLTLSGVVDSEGNAVSNPPIAVGTPFNIYYPYWSTNTFNSANPAPPSWMLYGQDTASVMVFAAQGVFADNAQQIASNLPSGVTDSEKYGVLLGALENQIVAAITRGIANLPGIVPQNWGNGTAPSQTTPTLTSASGSSSSGGSGLTAGTTYYYVVTATNANGETFGSFEFNATPTAEKPNVQVNWQPLSTAVASAFNVYRGTESQGENVLVQQVTNSGTTSSCIDTGAAGTSQQPPAYFPAGVPWSAYDAFFHQPPVSLNGAAYAGPYDDQGGQSSTISTSSPTAVSITLGPWGS